MKNIFRSYIGYFLLIFILIGCGIADPVSNSAGPSTPSNIILNVDVNPPSTDAGGSVIITATALFSGSGVPAAGITITAVSSAGGSLSTASAATDSMGQAFFTLSVTTPATVTLAVEDIAVSIRINING